MTVQVQTPSQYFSGPITIGTELNIQEFTFSENAHVSVKIRGAEDNWVYGSDYLVAGAGTLNRTVTVLKEVDDGDILAVFLDVPITQGVSPEEGGNLPAATLEYTLDKLTYICQDLNQRLQRALQVSVDSNFNGIIYDAGSHPGKFFVVNPDGSGITYSDYTASDLEYIANRLYASIDNVDIVADHVQHVVTTSNNIEVIDTVAESIVNVNLTGNSITNVNIVGDDLSLEEDSAINKVNANKTNIDINASNIEDIQNAYENAQTCITKAQEAALSAFNAAESEDHAEIWAEGTDEEVQALGGIHSSKGWSEESAKGQVQSDFEEEDTTAKSYIRNRPNLKDGYFPNLHVGLSDNLYDESTPIAIGTFNIRTTAGDESITTGKAILNKIIGNTEATGGTNPSYTSEVSEGVTLSNFNIIQFGTKISETGTYQFSYNNGVWTYNSQEVNLLDYGITAITRQRTFQPVVSSPDIQATYNIATFEAKIRKAPGTYTFVYEKPVEGEPGEWTWDGELVDLAQYGITIDGASILVNNDYISITYVPALATGTIKINYTAGTPGLISIANPTGFVATGMNQYDGVSFINNATIDSSGNVVAQTGSKVCYCMAVGGIYSGYVAYSENGYIQKIAYKKSIPVMGDTLDLSGATQDSELSSILFDENGFVCIAVINDSDLCVHPRWSSGQGQDTQYEEYSTTTVAIPTTDVDGTSLPTADYGMPAIDNVYDELNYDSKHYIKRIGYYEFSLENLQTVKAYGTKYIYDDETILYILKPEDITTYDLSPSLVNEYTANDYGIEYFTGTSVKLGTNISYGNNLKDKLRTDVVQISQQELSVAQQRQIQENIGTASITDALVDDTLRNSLLPNCILDEVITTKFDWTDGVATLKAGSILHIPDGFENGKRKFKQVTLTSDSIRTGLHHNDTTLPIVYANGEFSDAYPETQCFAQDTTPSLTTDYALWYDTAENRIKVTSNRGASWDARLAQGGIALPFGKLAEGDTTKYVKVANTLFQGIGYIGNSFFVKPGTVVIFPDGETNIKYTVTEMLLSTSTRSATRPDVLFLTYDKASNTVGTDRWDASAVKYCYRLYELLTNNWSQWQIAYVEETNLWYQSNDFGATWGARSSICIIGLGTPGAILSGFIPYKKLRLKDSLIRPITTLVPNLSDYIAPVSNGYVVDRHCFLVGVPVINDLNNNQFQLYIDGVMVAAIGWSGANWLEAGAYSNLLIPGQVITLTNQHYRNNLALYGARRITVSYTGRVN